jgi:capsular polysaccharide biosynthesis protein
MQLREYLSILRRYWPLVALLPLLAGGLSLALALRRPPAYQAAAKLLVTQAPSDAAASAAPALEDGATWTTTEYILDDLPHVLQSVAFAEDVRAAMAAEGHPIEIVAIQTGLRPEVTHRAVYLVATAAAPDTAAALLRSAVAALSAGGLKYWGRTPAGGLDVAVLDPPSAAAPVGGLRELVIDVGARVALALAAAVGLAFLLNALDDRLRSPGQAEQWTGARVIGVIPKD